MAAAELNAVRQPKYQTVKRHLLDLIAPLATGDSIPTERELATLLSTSRTTVRQALMDLVEEGLLVRRQGAGTFIARPGETWPLHLGGFTERSIVSGFAASTKLLSARSVRARGEIAVRLGLPSGQPAYRIERLRLADGSPIAVEISHLPAARFPNLSRLMHNNDSLYALLREHYGVIPVRAQERISTAPAPPREATLLGTETGVPMLVVGRHSRDTNDEPVEWVTSWYRGDRVSFVSDISAPPA